VTSDRTTVDFDHHSKDYWENRHALWAEARKCPVAHNPQHGGFWAISGYDEVATVSRDNATFSSKYEEKSPDGIEYLGIMGVPRLAGVPPALIAESEGPRHVALRRIINPFMLPPAVAEYRPFMEQCAAWFLDQKIADGQMDVVNDFSNPIPAVLTLKMVGLPPETWGYYAQVFHATVAYPPGTAEFIRAQGLMGEMVDGLLKVAAKRRQDPRHDLISELVALEVEGRHLSDPELIGVLWNLIGGGLDTTTSLTSLSLYHLDAQPELRQQLLDNPELLVPATEEFLRFTSVNETLTRTCITDTELAGQQLNRGDWVMMSWLAANFDEKVFPNPDQVILDRAPNPHLAFGVGPHRCIGMHLARVLFMVMMGEILERIPDYRVDRDATRFYRNNPELAGIATMPITFTAGKAVGAGRPF
jgi:cytochrome P450